MFDLGAHDTHPPASQEQLEALTAYAGEPLPGRYVDRLRVSNGLEAGEQMYQYRAEDPQAAIRAILEYLGLPPRLPPTRPSDPDPHRPDLYEAC